MNVDIRSRFAARMEKALTALEKRVAADQLRDRGRIERHVGAVQARLPRVADLFQLHDCEQDGKIAVDWHVGPQRRTWQEVREGVYLLRTNLRSSEPEQLWKSYLQLDGSRSCLPRSKANTVSVPSSTEGTPHQGPCDGGVSRLCLVG